MKILTKEQEAAHYNATLTGGIIGGAAGLGLGAVAVLGASRRYQFFRQLTLPLKAFLVTSSGTFAGIVAADHSSREYERSQNPIDMQYDEREKQRAEAERAGKTFTERAMEFGRKERYKIVGASWVASMFAAFAIVNRNKFLTGQQKLVQARVYAQFLTVGVLVATAAFEISDSKNETGRYETVTVLDPNDPEHKRYIEKRRAVGESDGDDMWKEMVAAEEERLKERDEDEARIRKEHPKKHPKHDSNVRAKKDTKKEEKSDDDKDDQKGDEKGESKPEKKDDKKDASKSETKDDKKEQPKGEKKDEKKDSKEEKQGGDEGKGTKKDKSANDAKEKK